MANHTNRSHAVLSASSSSRWLACPPSAQLCAALPDTVTDYAREGTCAHELAEYKVQRLLGNPASNPTENLDFYDTEMEDCTDSYAQYIAEQLSTLQEPMVLVEQRLDFSRYVPDGFGTADLVMIGGNTLRVIDFKYGKGVPVEVTDNAQMKLYALGALAQYALLYKVERVILSIAQLRLGEPTEWETTPDELYKWASEYVRPRAQQAYNGEGEFHAGDHCRFCRAKAKCRAYAEANMAVTEQHTPDEDPALLTDEEIGRLLTRAEPFLKWFGAVQTYALDAALDGKTIPGWKAVEGRSVRQFDDIDAAFADLRAAGIEDALLYERKPLTLSGVERLLGKKQFAELCGGHVVKPAGKPTLVPESDSRKPYSRAAADFAAIEQ